MTACPNCTSERIRRGGMAIWIVYIALIAVGVPAVLIFDLNAAIVALIMIAVAALSHIVFNLRVCIDCGHQWKP